MTNLVYLFEAILNENPNQAIKFLKDKNLDPATNPKGKEIFDVINNITRGDGYTALLTRFHINERKPINELEKLHQYLRLNKVQLNNLPKPVVNYETYRQLRNDIDGLEDQKVLRRLYNQLSPALKEQANELSVRERQALKELAKKFEILKPEQQRHFMKKVFGYKNIKDFIKNISQYIIEVENQQDYESTKQKITETPGANIMYDNPEKDILIAHIDSYEASQKLGCTSAWCITRDTARFREYKRGGNSYFFIWDYNYPVQDPNFFIATAFNEKTPENSRTHEHLNDKQVNLGNILSSKDLSFDIFEKYLGTYNQNRLANAGQQSGLIIALKEKDRGKIVELIENSETITNLRESDNDSVRVDRWDDTKVYLDLTSTKMKEMLELGEEFDYINNLAYNDYGNNGYDSDEVDYMQNGLSADNRDLILDLAKKIGVPKKDYTNLFEKEGALGNFLKEYHFDKIIDTYLSEFSDAQSNAEEAAARELINEVPFDVDNGYFKIETMLKYYVDNQLTADTFDELVDQIKEKLPEFYYDTISDARYNDMDYDELNRQVKNDLEGIIDEIETDENNEYYMRARLLGDSKEILTKLNFNIPGNKTYLARRTLNNIVMTVTDVESVEGDDDTLKIMANLTISYPSKVKGEHINRKLRVPIESIKNYIDQYELPLAEQKIIKNILNYLNSLR